MVNPDYEDVLSADELVAIRMEFQPLSPYGLAIAARVLDGSATAEERALFNPEDLAQAKELLNRHAPDDERLFLGS